MVQPLLRFHQDHLIHSHLAVFFFFVFASSLVHYIPPRQQQKRFFQNYFYTLINLFSHVLLASELWVAKLGYS